jgi:hypothetical protein
MPPTGCSTRIQCDRLLTDPPYATDVDDIAACCKPVASDGPRQGEANRQGLRMQSVPTPVEQHAYCSVRMPDQTFW